MEMNRNLFNHELFIYYVKLSGNLVGIIKNMEIFLTSKYM